MAVITASYLGDEIEDARKILNHNIAELIKANANVESLKESIASTKGAISAFEYLIKGKLEEDPETKKTVSLDAKPDDSNPVGEEA